MSCFASSLAGESRPFGFQRLATLNRGCTGRCTRFAALRRVPQPAQPLGAGLPPVSSKALRALLTAA